MHGWASVIPLSKGLTDYAFVYEKGDIDFDLGLVAGYKFNRNIGIFGEGRYLKYLALNVLLQIQMAKHTAVQVQQILCQFLHFFVVLR